MIRITRNLKRKDFARLKKSKDENDRNEQLNQDKVKKIEERLMALEKKTGLKEV